MQWKRGRVASSLTAAFTRAKDNTTKNHSHAGQNCKIPCLPNYVVLTTLLYLIRRASKFPVLNSSFALFASTIRAELLRNSHQQGNTDAKSPTEADKHPLLPERSSRSRADFGQTEPGHSQEEAHRSAMENEA